MKDVSFLDEKVLTTSFCLLSPARLQILLKRGDYSFCFFNLPVVSSTISTEM